MPAPRQKLSGMTFFNTGVKLDIFVSEMNAGAGHEYLPGGSGQAGSGCRIGQSAFPVDLACRAPISCQEASLYMRSVFGYYLFAACIAYCILSTLTITIYCRLHVRTMSNAQLYYGSLVLLRVTCSGKKPDVYFLYIHWVWFGFYPKQIKLQSKEQNVSYRRAMKLGLESWSTLLTTFHLKNKKQTTTHLGGCVIFVIPPSSPSQKSSYASKRSALF